MNNQRFTLLDLAQIAIHEVRGDRLVERAAANAALTARLEVAAVGKAACAMMAGAHRVLGDSIRRSLLITKTGYVDVDLARNREIEIIEAGHPLPTEGSLNAGRRLLEWLATAYAQTHLLFLVSGGTSSLVEVPVSGIGLPELQFINRRLLASGLDIQQINRVRQRISRIKGGGLLHYVGTRNASVWLLSDVRGDDPASIGSGMLYPVAAVQPETIDLPADLEILLRKLPADSRASHRDEHLPVPEHLILGNLRMACEAARIAAERSGHHACYHEQELDGDAAAVGRQLAARLLTLPAGVHVWGGETTVRLPADPGRGGRNQHLALAAAMELAGQENICLLALGTDGSDGPGEDAGALVDGGTISRGELAGLSAADALRRADSGGFLEASGDLISTGATGTNVRDLVIAIKA